MTPLKRSCLSDSETPQSQRASTILPSHYQSDNRGRHFHHSIPSEAETSNRAGVPCNTSPMHDIYIATISIRALSRTNHTCTSHSATPQCVQYAPGPRGPGVGDRENCYVGRGYEQLSLVWYTHCEERVRRTVVREDWSVRINALTRV
jgi:hypothetical protein